MGGDRRAEPLRVGCPALLEHPGIRSCGMRPPGMDQRLRVGMPGGGAEWGKRCWRRGHLCLLALSTSGMRDFDPWWGSRHQNPPAVECCKVPAVPWCEQILVVAVPSLWEKPPEIPEGFLWTGQAWKEQRMAPSSGWWPLPSLDHGTGQEMLLPAPACLCRDTGTGCDPWSGGVSPQPPGRSS